MTGRLRSLLGTTVRRPITGRGRGDSLSTLLLESDQPGDQSERGGSHPLVEETRQHREVAAGEGDPSGRWTGSSGPARAHPHIPTGAEQVVAQGAGEPPAVERSSAGVRRETAETPVRTVPDELAEARRSLDDERRRLEAQVRQLKMDRDALEQDCRQLAGERRDLLAEHQQLETSKGLAPDVEEPEDAAPRS